MRNVLRGFVFCSVSLAFCPKSEAGTLTERIAARHTVKKTDVWQGGRRTVFDFNGYDAWVVEPPTGTNVPKERPWTWTMQWRDAFVERTGVPRLLKCGWHHASIDTFRHRMDETGLAVSKAFQDFLVNDLGFEKKTNLIGLSWGGFFSVRYAAKNPDCVAKIYLDCPLLTFLHAKDNILKNRGPWATDAQVDWSEDPRMPVNMAQPIASAQIPVLLAYGDADVVVDPKWNSELFIRRFKHAGGDIQVVRRPKGGHHPHGFNVSEPGAPAFFMVCGKERLRPEATPSDP